MLRLILKDGINDFRLSDVVDCCTESCYDKKIGDWEFISKVVDDVDEEDGVADYTFVLKRISDQKYFELNPTSWCLYEGEINSDLREVFRTEKTVIVYE